MVVKPFQSSCHVTGEASSIVASDSEGTNISNLAINEAYKEESKKFKRMNEIVPRANSTRGYA